MRDVLVVTRREIATMLRRGSFYVAALVAPLTIGAIFYGFVFLNAEFGVRTPANGREMAGYVDRAGLVRGVPPELGMRFVAYATEEQARAALQAGTIGSYFVVAPDYRTTGRIVRVSPQVTFTSASAPDTRAFETLLRASVAGDAQLARRLAQPLDLQMRLVRPRGANVRAPAPGLNQGVSFALAMLLAFSIVNGGGWLVQAIAEEKENRTIEILLTSIQPWKLLAGKLLGLGTVSLLQLGVWIALGRFLTGGAAGSAVSLGAADPAVWSWMVVFFLLGFLFVGAIMTMLGAVGASIRESGQISGLITLPVVAPVWVATSIAENPDGILARVLSLVPLTAPVTIMLRLSQGSVPAWELAASIALLAVGIAGAIWLAARLFRGTTLLAGVRPTPRAIWRTLRQA